MSKKYGKGGEAYEIQKERASRSYWKLSPEERKVRNKRTALLNRLRKAGVRYKASNRKYRLSTYNYRLRYYPGRYFRCTLCKRRRLLTNVHSAEAHLLSHRNEIQTYQEYTGTSPHFTHEDYKVYMEKMKKLYLKPAKPRIHKGRLDIAILEAEYRQALQRKRETYKKKLSDYIVPVEENEIEKEIERRLEQKESEKKTKRRENRLRRLGKL